MDARIGAAAATLGAVLILTSCSPSHTAVAPDKYTQTWATSYASTTCTDWTTRMTAPQRWAAAADMLTGARNKGDGGTGLPSDALVTTFMGGIGTACVVETMTITDVAVGLYMTERARFQPTP